MNPHTDLIESLGWMWTGPFGWNTDEGPHYAVIRNVPEGAVPDTVMLNTLTLAGWRIKKAPFPGYKGHTYIWAYPPT